MKKNIIKFFLIISLFFFFSPLFVFAQKEEQKEAVTFTPQVTIPGSKFLAGASTTVSGSLSTIGEYIKSIYNYLILLVGLVAVIASMIGGIIWLTAAGNTTRISTAKSWIGGSLTGLVLALSSYLILQTINPKLTDFRDQNIGSIGEINVGCCRIPKDVDTDGYFTGYPGKGLTRDLTANECYLRAVELKEDVKTMKELKDDPKYKNLNDNAIIEKYLGSLKNGASTGWFLPNFISTNFTGCTKVGACFLFSTYSKYNRDEAFDDLCFRTTNLICDELRSGVSDGLSSPYHEFFSSDYSGCSDAFVREFVVPKRRENSVYAHITKEDLTPLNFEQAAKYHSIYKYNTIVYFGKGKLGEPCGDSTDEGICVPTGKDCTALEFKSRNWGYGGRSCGDGVKCCNQN